MITATHEDAGWAAGFNNAAAFNQKLWVVQMRNGLYGAMIGTYPNAIAEERMN